MKPHLHLFMAKAELLPACFMRLKQAQNFKYADHFVLHVF